MFAQVCIAGDSFGNTFCTCPVGQGLCHHTIATLYEFTHYKKLKLKQVPSSMAKTSIRQVYYLYNHTNNICQQIQT